MIPAFGFVLPFPSLKSVPLQAASMNMAVTAIPFILIGVLSDPIDKRSKLLRSNFFSQFYSPVGIWPHVGMRLEIGKHFGKFTGSFKEVREYFCRHVVEAVLFPICFIGFKT